MALDGGHQSEKNGTTDTPSTAGTTVTELNDARRGKYASGFDFWRSALGGAVHVVAPMVEQSELAWRVLCRRYGAQLCYTPMMHANVFARDTTYRKENFQVAEGLRVSNFKKGVIFGAPMFVFFIIAKITT